jgi:threonine synthase
MNYVSTRGLNADKDFAAALLEGLAPDGGLYVPDHWPQASHLETHNLETLAKGDYATLSAYLLDMFGVGVLGAAAVTQAALRTSAAFAPQGHTPLVQLEDNLWLLELFHGPTMAFKDMAMQMIAPLTDAALERSDERLTLVTATSGDTGAAAVRAFAGSQRVRLVVFHPLGRVSQVQRLQMTTVEADNILNIGVEGDFDDCQRLVKALLGAPALKSGALISSVNSINWGRLLGQVPYFLAASAACGAQNPQFIVPTGNFGDAFAGWAARKIGGNIGPITAAVNANDALSQAINQGRYVRKLATPTQSVSMDVQAPSNFERLVFEASGRNGDVTRSLFETFGSCGEVVIDSGLHAALAAQVSAVGISELETRDTIKLAHERYGQIICPHTAVALAAAFKLPSHDPKIVLATAHAAKFPDSVKAALGFAPEVPETIAKLYGRKENITTMRADIAQAITTVQGFAVR